MSDLRLVTIGLGLDGGGRAAAARLVAEGMAGWADRRRAAFDVLALENGWPGPTPTAEVAGAAGAPAAVPVPPLRAFGGRRAALARAVWADQLRAPRRALVFDHLGPARLEAPLPAPLRAPYLVLLLGIEAWRPLTGSRRRALAGARLRVAISDYTARRTRRANPWLGGRADDAIEVLPLALEERPPGGVREAAVLEQAGEGFVLMVGRMAPGERYKGHDELLEALALLAGRGGRGDRGSAPRLVVAGDGADRPRLEAKAAELGVAERVRFTGFVSEATLAELYRRAALFAMPSRGEGFGLVYLEAMRAGTACLALADTAAAEVVVDGETGRLLAAAEPAALAAALDELLGAPEALARLGAAGRRRYFGHFTPDRFAERLAPLLDRLTGPLPGALPEPSTDRAGGR